MTPSELKANILANDPDSHFFDRKTMQFFWRHDEELWRAENGNRRCSCLGAIPEKAGKTRPEKFGVFPGNGFQTSF